jgi:hypothetical protein
MKVTFQATLDDFVDIAMRSSSHRLGVNFYVSLAFISIGVGVVIAVPTYLITRSLWATVIMFIAAPSGIIIYNLGNREDVIRRAFAKQGIGPMFVTVEITGEGIAFQQLAGDDSESSFHPWSAYESIEETLDAIYFKRKNGFYSAVRKRGFTSEEEKNEFLNLVNKYRNAVVN